MATFSKNTLYFPFRVLANILLNMIHIQISKAQLIVYCKNIHNPIFLEPYILINFIAVFVKYYRKVTSNCKVWRKLYTIFKIFYK